MCRAEDAGVAGWNFQGGRLQNQIITMDGSLSLCRSCAVFCYTALQGVSYSRGGCQGHVSIPL
jgi:hypothetical protein